MRFIRLKDVMETTGLGKTTIYKYIEQGNFPKPVELGYRAVGWIESEISEWVMARVEERDQSLEVFSCH